MTEKPKFSVVVPLYNHEKYIRDALASVLRQTVLPAEIVVVDDGSHDQGCLIAEKLLRDIPYAKVIRQENRGAHNAINRAIGETTGSHIAVLNSDDLFEPEKLERCGQLFATDSGTSLIFGRVNIINSDGQHVDHNETTEWLQRSYDFLDRSRNTTLALLNENFGVTTSNFVFTREAWEAAGGFKNLRYCHDLDFLMAASRYGKLHFDRGDAPHISYRVHPTNTIKETLEKVHLEISAVIASNLDSAVWDPQGIAQADERIILEDILARKPFLSKIASLVPYRRPFDQREAFYDTLSANPPARFETRSRAAAPPARDQGKPFNVAIELSNFDRGGLEKVVLDCAIDFQRCGIRPLIISCGEIGHLGTIAQEQNIETIALPKFGREDFYENLLRTRNINLSMSHFSHAGYKIFKKLGIPNITFIHNIYAMLRGQAITDFIDADKFVDRYISVSMLATDYTVEKYGINRGKIATIPNGLIIDEHEKRLMNAAPADRAALSVRDSDYMFLNVASYNLHKSHYLMADAMRLILRKRDDIKIVCVGNVIYPPHVEQLNSDLHKWGIEDHILLPGYFEDVAPLHKTSDAFLLPSLIEGWSIAMNEAMYYGKPMILTETGGAPEAIVDNDVGLLIPNEYGAVTNLDSYVLDKIGYEQRRFHTAPYLAAAMETFADNREFWRRRGSLGHEKVVNKYDFADVTQRYIALCRELLA